MKVDNSSIERVEEFKYLGRTLTYQNSIQEKIKSRLKLGNACYHSVQNLLSILYSINIHNKNLLTCKQFLFIQQLFSRLNSRHHQVLTEELAIHTEIKSTTWGYPPFTSKITLKMYSQCISK